MKKKLNCTGEAFTFPHGFDIGYRLYYDLGCGNCYQVIKV